MDDKTTRLVGVCVTIAAHIIALIVWLTRLGSRIEHVEKVVEKHEVIFDDRAVTLKDHERRILIIETKGSKR